MWVTLNVFDGPTAADGTYFFNYFQIEQSDKPGTYESFSCWAPYQAGRATVPPADITIVNYYGKRSFKQGVETVDGRAMEFVNAEDRVPRSEEQVWTTVDEKLETSYASTSADSKSSQACTSRRAIDATKDFNLKTGRAYTFLAGYSVFDAINSTLPSATGDSSSD